MKVDGRTVEESSPKQEDFKDFFLLSTSEIMVTMIRRQSVQFHCYLYRTFYPKSHSVKNSCDVKKLSIFEMSTRVLNNMRERT